VSGAERLLARTLFVTGNRMKLAEARRLGGSELEGVDLDLPEIQSLDLEEVLRAKGEEAVRRLGRGPGPRLERPLLVDETALGLAALNGFPGPLIKWLLGSIGAEGTARLAEAQGDRRAQALSGLLWTDGERTVVVRGVVEGVLVLPRGEARFGWDTIFQPDGGDRTYAELEPEEKDAISQRGQAWRKLIAELDRLQE
jgi:non-canonical purine NTP pyrophosphatase (RdgB/HAM1 family)